MMCVHTSCSADPASRKVAQASATLPDFPEIDVSAPDRFLNDLMLSPLWKVEKARDGSFIARARSITSDSPFEEAGRRFLFELMAAPDKTLAKDYRIHDHYLEGSKTFSSFRICVVFTKPDMAHVTVGASGQKATLDVHESYEPKIGPNSSSELAVKLSSQHEIYVMLYEQVYGVFQSLFQAAAQGPGNQTLSRPSGPRHVLRLL